jgi:hypothetical protein
VDQNQVLLEPRMAFFVGCLFATFVGRKIGWALSRALLYTSSWAVCIVLCLAWAAGVAYGLRLFIIATQPGLLLKIFGYGAAAYIAVPNYGLLDEGSIPPSEMPRHAFIKGVPLVLFIVASVAFAFTVSAPSADLAADQLAPNEFSVLSSVLSKKEPLKEGDLDSLRGMLKGYAHRTGHSLSRKDVAVVTEAFNTSTAYYYQLAQSRLLSWDTGQYETTKEFDTLYAQMERDGWRKPSKLMSDKNRIRLAARHEPVETDEGGLQYDLNRDSILRNFNDIKVQADNTRQVISVMNELAR